MTKWTITVDETSTRTYIVEVPDDISPEYVDDLEDALAAVFDRQSRLDAWVESHPAVTADLAERSIDYRSGVVYQAEPDDATTATLPPEVIAKLTALATSSDADE